MLRWLVWKWQCLQSAFVQFFDRSGELLFDLGCGLKRRWRYIQAAFDVICKTLWLVSEFFPIAVLYFKDRESYKLYWNHWELVTFETSRELSVSEIIKRTSHLLKLRCWLRTVTDIKEFRKIN